MKQEQNTTIQKLLEEILKELKNKPVQPVPFCPPCPFQHYPPAQPLPYVPGQFPSWPLGGTWM